MEYSNPVLSVGTLNIDTAKVEGTVLFDSGNKQLEASFEYSGSSIKVITRNPLRSNTNYTIKIFMGDGRRIKAVAAGAAMMIWQYHYPNTRVKN